MIMENLMSKLYGEELNYEQALCQYWDDIISLNIANEEELQLITSINGYNEQTLDDVVYVRTGYHSLYQYLECEPM